MPTDPSCLFCKIVAGQIPCHKVAENEHALAFLDIGPLSRGHTLVIPKGHWVTLEQVPGDVAAGVGSLIPRVAKAVVEATGVKDWNLLQNNGKPAHQVVMHVHFHIIPKPNEKEGLGIGWPAGKLGQDEATALLMKIRASMD
ncbi:MAG: HIT domain-containing protein [Phycisphaera sp.]|nr:HIT domain-containing protein [Phycisphaera sp.]